MLLSFFLFSFLCPTEQSINGEYIQSLSEDIAWHEKVKEDEFCEIHKNELKSLFDVLTIEVYRNPNRHILDIFESVRESLKYNKVLVRDIDELLQVITRPQITEEFPYDNVAYQALILFIKTWPKKDTHCHISPSLSPKWVIEKVRKNWSEYQDGFEKYSLHRAISEDDSSQVNGVTPEVINAFLSGKSDSEIKKIFDIYEFQFDAFDIPMNFASKGNVDLFLEALRSVVRNYFSDGVVSAELYFNPCKKYGKSKIDPLEILEMADKVVSEEEFYANKLYGRQHHVNFILSFDQSNFKNKSNFIATIKRATYLNNVKKFSFLSRISGVDLGGMESDHTKRSDWKDLLSAAADARSRNNQFATVSHVGDRWNVDEEYNNDFEKHLNYVYDALSIDGLSFIGHGNLLWLDYKIVRPYPDLALRLFDPSVSPAQKDKIEAIVELIKKKGIRIGCLPKREFRVISMMKQFPFYYWINRGVDVCLGVDGRSYAQASLSEWIAWLLLASPRFDTPLRAMISVEKMKNIVCVEKGY